ncbi:MAG TPA: O-antigen ligase family protein [Gaiellales bacterium]|nr:O-antigen ligase family protein [Gaiellales bacterium]
MAAAAYGVGLASGRSEMLLAAGLGLAIPLLFAWRLEAGVLLLVLTRPSLDVFADRSLASFHGLQLNPASVLAVLVIAIGVPYMVEAWPRLRTAPAILPYLLFAAVAAPGILVAPSTGGAVTEWLRLCAVLVTYALAYLAADRPAAVARLLAAIVVSALIPAAVGVGQWANGTTHTIGDVNRATGTFLQPDPYGIYLAVATLAALTMVLASRGIWRWCAAIVMIAAAAALVVSYTRTGWVMVVLGAIVLGLVRYRPLLLIVPLMVGAALLLPGVQSRVQSVNQTQEIQYGTGNSFQSRVSLWEQNLPKAQQKPLTGLGLGAIVEQSDTQSHVHSDYVRAAVETGLFGFLAFVWLLLGALVGCLAALRWAARSRSVPLQAAALAGIAGSAAYLLASGDSNLMTQSAVSGTAWALFACAHAAGRLGREAVAPRPLRPTVARRLRVLGAPGIRTAAYSVQRATR